MHPLLDVARRLLAAMPADAVLITTPQKYITAGDVLRVIDSADTDILQAALDAGLVPKQHEDLIRIILMTIAMRK